MNWSFRKCELGDIIRSRVGEIFHYGIFVSEEEIIQFGYNPSLREKDKDNIVVIATDIDTFSCGQMVEVGELTFSDHKKRFAPQKVVDNARSRLGEGGYNIIHNNCEHFAYECYTGIKYSSHEEEARAKWKNMPYLNVYISYIPNNIVIEKLLSKERNEEIELTSNLEVKTQKYWAWKILELAIVRDLKIDPSTVNFIKDKNGKWSTDNFKFSISHTKNVVAIAISNQEVGIDIEEKNRLNNSSDNLKAKILHKKESVKSDLELLELWTKKEAIYKYIGKNSFIPSKILTTDYPVSSFDVDDSYVVSICSNEKERSRFYGLYNGKIGLFQGKVNKLCGTSL